MGLEFWALFVVLCYNAYSLNEIRKILRACFVELNTARWESGVLLRAKDQGQSLPPLRRQA
jgi:hypothetical protein